MNHLFHLVSYALFLYKKTCCVHAFKWSSNYSFNFLIHLGFGCIEKPLVLAQEILLSSSVEKGKYTKV